MRDFIKRKSANLLLCDGHAQYSMECEISHLYFEIQIKRSTQPPTEENLLLSSEYNKSATEKFIKRKFSFFREHLLYF